jgi:E3 ubiquitin ligase SMURF1/2
MESVDPDIYRSLKWMLDTDLSEMDIPQFFVVERDKFGKLLHKELKPGGQDEMVTNDNKEEYVRLYVQLRFRDGIEKQFLALQKGFHELIPAHLLKEFDERELELLISGLGKVDVVDWKNNTRLKNCTPDTDTIKWFWQVSAMTIVTFYGQVHTALSHHVLRRILSLNAACWPMCKLLLPLQAVESYDDEKRARLLQFVTGSSRVPLDGFKALQGSTGAVGPRLFTIHLVDQPIHNLPKAHTCFNRIDLPPYNSHELLYEKLTIAVEQTVGFHVE